MQSTVGQSLLTQHTPFITPNRKKNITTSVRSYLLTFNTNLKIPSRCRTFSCVCLSYRNARLWRMNRVFLFHWPIASRFSTPNLDRGIFGKIACCFSPFIRLTERRQQTEENRLLSFSPVIIALWKKNTETPSKQTNKSRQTILRLRSYEGNEYFHTKARNLFAAVFRSQRRWESMLEIILHPPIGSWKVEQGPIQS